MLYQEYEIVEPLKPFVKVIWSMENDAVKNKSLTAIGFEAGCYDQAHFIS